MSTEKILLKEAEKLLRWASEEFEKRGISADNWYAEYEIWRDLDLADWNRRAAY